MALMRDNVRGTLMAFEPEERQRKMKYQFHVVEHPYSNLNARSLITSLDRELARIYGAGDLEPVEPDDFTRPGGVFIVGYNGDFAVACGAMRLRRDLRPGEIDAEIKRMYVERGARRRGWGRALLAELEKEGRLAGASRAVLEDRRE